ncbi:secondary thiamine-phosphate synthase enzyme YjbQ [Rhizosaccharibacter radicis]|uniref:Secondary thiamine-phosphate synthase enzyme YjbQ n=1 Tax=Rhizosaccharibacter radicis TaxID=2782605 RepID=A0ABT1VTR4_9PROT|nr:secondary thiamine-phosphate synthase enzyme YjbQ [Acetobacteraceae bacterium KSS12]
MRQALHTLSINTRRKGLLPISRPVLDWVGAQGIETGLLTIWCRHTSASLLVQENADPDVQTDIESWFDRVAPEGPHYVHDIEGPDDMPAHLRSILSGVQLTIPVSGGRPVLGTWQGIYLFEHRARPHRREVVLHLLGE